MGAHAAAPSRIAPETGLGEFIASDPARILGKETARRFGELPFLFKLLAAKKPLSLQAHPGEAQARAGFERESSSGLEQSDSRRLYSDPRHKPEMLCALAPFTALCGFREPGEIARLLTRLCEHAPEDLCRALAPLERSLRMKTAEETLRGFMSELFSSGQALASSDLTTALEAASRFEKADRFEEAEAFDLAAGLARLWPKDPTALAPLFLNVFSLDAGEAIFLKPGAPHAYLSGFALEIMANSDNVLRGGLSSKKIEPGAFMEALDFAPYRPEIARRDPLAENFRYPDFCREFSLSFFRGSGGERLLSLDGPAICLVASGAADAGGEVLRKGESAFVHGSEKRPLSLRGDYGLYVASVGRPEAGAP